METLGLLFDTKKFSAVFREATRDSKPAVAESAPQRVHVPVVSSSNMQDEASLKIVSILDDLLAQTIELRHLYLNARRQTCDERLRQLRLMFDEHYKEQLRLVDVLVDRMRMLGGGSRLFAADLLQSTGGSHVFRGRQGRNLLLRELVDAHDVLLNTFSPGETEDAPNDGGWRRDFAVGQVVLANELQSGSIRELMLGRGLNPEIEPVMHGTIAPYIR